MLGRRAARWRENRRGAAASKAYLRKITKAGIAEKPNKSNWRRIRSIVSLPRHSSRREIVEKSSSGNSPASTIKIRHRCRLGPAA